MGDSTGRIWGWDNGDRGDSRTQARTGAGLAGAQSETLGDKPWDIGVWFGGGLSVPGGTSDTQVLNAGLRLGKVLTGNHGSGFIRGNFEWSADFMPHCPLL